MSKWLDERLTRFKTGVSSNNDDVPRQHRRGLMAVIAGALLPVALTWATMGAAVDPQAELREKQLIITTAIPDCNTELMVIRGFYFVVNDGDPIDVSLELIPAEGAR